tara:strand:+ start:95 stop:1486 length:1392 start_codon:yes stop_codon:yes gene_type:complete
MVLDLVILSSAFVFFVFCSSFFVAFLFKRRLAEAEKKYLDVERSLSGIKTENSALRERTINQERRISEIETELRQERQALVAERERTEAAHIELSKMDTMFSEQRKQWDEKLVLLKEAKESMREGFNNLANDIFEKKQKEFRSSSSEQLRNVLDPLKERIKSFEQKVSDEAKERFSLIKEVRSLQELNSKIAKDAVNLTNALKGESKTQGVWGELVLETILEKSGLEKGREYEIQVSYQNEHGRRFQPDAVVRLPEGKDIIIDSKVSLTHYERFCSAGDDEERSGYLKQHVLSVRRHIKELSEKEYHLLSGLRTVDFVLMFVPVEAAFSSAAGAEPELYSEAFDKNIGIVTPSTLLATLRMVQNIWRFEKQNKNAMEISNKAGALYDKFVNFVGDLELVGSRLGAVTTAYESAHGKLVSGRGNLIKRAEEMKTLGAKTNKSLPDSLLEIPQIETKDSTTESER